jgi:uncharacterized protein (TIGR03083 family)
MESNPRVWIDVLRSSYDRLASAVEPLSAEQVRAQSYDTEWSVAQVLSHLGSGAEIGLMMLRGALGEADLPSREDFQPVWDQWNAKSPDEQAADALSADNEQVAALESLSDEQLGRMKLPFLGMELDSVGVVRLRLGEHALHTWDVEVTFDPAATVADDATALLIDNVPQFLAPRLGKPQQDPLTVRIRTTDPARDYLLTAGEAVQMSDWQGGDAAEAAEVQMPAEALLRLAYGRLDPEHTPASVTGDPAVLDRLRAVFPGF